MKGLKKPLRKIAILSLLMVCFVAILAVTLWLYTATQLRIARIEGVYSSPEDGMRVLVTESWIDIDRVEIVYAGTNSFDGSSPHVWFVTAQVWATRRGDGKPIHQRGYDTGGSFFLRVQDGWVHVPEGRFPELVGFGMQLFGPIVDIRSVVD
jgi:hypothetical protein